MRVILDTHILLWAIAEPSLQQYSDLVDIVQPA
jgi:PIN domain nuclease of toxin-antitoxin system